MGNLMHTVSGGIASFRSAARVPIDSLKCHFLPVQEGSGDPSPENVRPITGWNGIQIQHIGKNFIKKYYTTSTENRGLTIIPTERGIHVSGTAIVRTACMLSDTNHIPFKTNDKVTFSLYLNGDISQCENPYVGYYKKVGEYGSASGTLKANNNYTFTWTIPSAYGNVNTSYIDSYIYIPEGVTVDFEIGLQAELASTMSGFESYKEYIIPITFPNFSTNLFDSSNEILTAFVNSNGVYSNNSTDTRTTAQLSIQSYSQSTYLSTLCTYTFSNTGNVSFSFIITEPSCDYIVFKHNGSVKDFRIKIPFDYGLGIYTVTCNIISNDPTTIGGLQISDIQIKHGGYGCVDYTNNILYGGYIDLITGDIVAEQASFTFKCSDTDQYDLKYTNTQRLRFTTNIPLKGTGLTKAGITYCNKLVYNYTSNDIIHYYTTENNAKGYIYAYVPIDANDDDEYTFVVSLYTPQRVGALTSQQLKTFIDYNNIWSNTNDITEVAYQIHDSNMIQTVKKQIAGNEPHIETISNILTNFNTTMKAPLKECKINLFSTQKGSGNPSSENIRDIIGQESIQLKHSKKNLFDISFFTNKTDVTVENNTISGYVAPIHNVTYAQLMPIKIPKGATFTTSVITHRSVSDTGAGWSFWFIYANGDRVRPFYTSNAITTPTQYTGTITAEDDIIGLDFGYYNQALTGIWYISDIQIEINSFATHYENYSGETISYVIPPLGKNLFKTNAEDWKKNNVYSYYKLPSVDDTYVLSFIDKDTSVNISDINVGFSYELPENGSIAGKGFNWVINAGRITNTKTNIVTDGSDASLSGKLCQYIMIYPRNTLARVLARYDIQLEKNSAATSFEPYTNTLYGGYIDLLRGELVKTHELVNLKAAGQYKGSDYAFWYTSGIQTLNETNDGVLCNRCLLNINTSGKELYDSFTWYNNGIIRWTEPGTEDMTLADYNTYLNTNPLLATYKLNIPITYILTPTQLKSFYGINNIWSDSNGRIEVKYWTH